MFRFALPALFSAALFLSPMSAMAEPEIGKPAPDFTAKDIEGKTVQLSELKGKPVVLEWNNPGCPFVHKHYDGGNMQKLQSNAKGKAVWLTINSGAQGKQGHMTDAEAKAYVAKEKASPTHYILDPQGEIGHLYGAKATPHMFVIDKNGDMAYMGAIDDKSDVSVESTKTAKNYVKAALDSLLAGKPVEPASTQPYGCGVKYAD